VRRRLLALAASALLFGAACVSRNAGIATAQREVEARTGMAVPWQGDGDQDDKLVRDLLAKPLTADAAARIALWNNADVQASLDEVGVARAAVVSALALPNPKASVGAFFGEDSGPDLDLELTIDIVDLFLIPARESGASTALEASALDAAGAALDVAFEAKAAFFE
jgi:cobalt-zinc-cadmium efflux system outer membrane protein